MEIRRALLFVAVAGAVLEGLIACSSSSHPDSAQTGADSSPVSPGTPGTPADASTKDAGDAGPDASDGASTAIDAQSPPCLGDTTLNLEGGTPCSGTDCSAVCSNIFAHYRQGVAEHAAACISKLSSCTDPTVAFACVDDALARACAVSSATSYCTPLVKSCDPTEFTITQSGCEIFATGMNEAGRDIFGGCIQAKVDAGTCPDEVAECANEIRQ